MKTFLSKVINYFNNLKFSYKTSFLIFIIAGGMLCIIILSQISLFTLKNDFDILFEKRTKGLIELEHIKDSYKINIQDTLNDFEKKELNFEQSKDVLKLAIEIIYKNWLLYQENSSLKNRFFIVNWIKEFVINPNNLYENKVLKDEIIKNINSKMKTLFYMS